MDLEEYRKQIDDVDRQIIGLIARRMKIVEEVGKYKAKESLPPLDETRWDKVLERRMKWAEEISLNPVLIRQIWNLMHKNALKIETEVT